MSECSNVECWNVEIEEHGRAGSVVYRDADGVITCHWEFSGGTAVASVHIGTLAEWHADHPWAVERRSEIIGRITTELIRQRAPSCVPQVDEASGWLHLIHSGVSPAPSPPPRPVPLDAHERSVQFVRRYSQLRGRLAVAVGVIATAVAGVMWLAKTALSVETTGIRFGDSVRSGNTIATMIQRLEPYIPSLHRDPSRDRYTVGILLHAADGSVAPRSLEIARGLTGSQAMHSKFIGVDAQRIWFHALGSGAVDLGTGRLLSAAEFARIQALVPPSSISPNDLAKGDRALLRHLAAGGVVSPSRFILLENSSEARSLRPGSTASPVVAVERTLEPATLWLSDIEH